MFRLLANTVAVIHWILIAILFGGYLVPKTWVKVKVFHSFLGLAVFVSQVIYGFKCPLVILEEYFRKLDDPNYVIYWTPFTERLFQKLFGISISQNLVFIIITIIAASGVAYLITVFSKKEEE